MKQGIMHVVCAWCGQSLGFKSGPDGMTSHGMCRACYAREISKYYEEDEHDRDNMGQHIENNA